LDVNLDDIDYAKISEGRKHPDREWVEGEEDYDYTKPQSPNKFHGDQRGGDDDLEDCSCDQKECRRGVCDPNCLRCGDNQEEFNAEDFMSEATKRQKDAKQSLARHKVATKNKRTKFMKRKSNAQMKKENTMTLGDVFLNELSTFNKDELPGSGDISKQMKDFDDLLQKFTKEALELHKKFEEEMKVDPAGGQTSPQMAPRIAERNRMLMVRCGVLRKMASAAVQACEIVRREG